MDSSNISYIHEDDIRSMDILCSRGNGVRNKSGNVFYTALIKEHKPHYHNAMTTACKKKVVTRVRNIIQSTNPPGRFLKPCESNGEDEEEPSYWYELTGRTKINMKIAQALREKRTTTRLKKPKKAIKDSNTFEANDTGSASDSIGPGEVTSDFSAVGPSQRSSRKEEDMKKSSSFIATTKGKVNSALIGLKRRRQIRTSELFTAIDGEYHENPFSSRDSGPAVVSTLGEGESFVTRYSTSSTNTTFASASTASMDIMMYPEGHSFCNIEPLDPHSQVFADLSLVEDMKHYLSNIHND